jgi:phage tail sheath protein FI
MPEYLSPGVYIEEIQGPQPIQPVGTSTGAFVGIAQSGPINTPTLITNYTQFANTFGGYLPGAYLAYAVQNFFNEGGTICYVVRAFVHSAGPSGAVPYPDVATANLTTSGISTDPVAVVVNANSPGTWGNALSVQVLADTFDPTNVPICTLDAGGSGYQAGDALTLQQLTCVLNAGGAAYKDGDVLTLVQTGGSGGTITVSTVSGTGAVETFSVTTVGTGYTTADGLAVTGGSGSGATFNIISGSGGTITVNSVSTGTGYKAGDVLTLDQTGASGGTITVNSVSTTGAVEAVSVTTNGTGYTAANGLAVTGGSGTGAKFNITSVSGGMLTVSISGPVVTFSVTNIGTGYSQANGVTVSGGNGNGATFDINLNPNQEFQIQVFETASGSTLPTLVETYTHVSMIEADTNGVPNPNAVDQRINGVSNYIEVVHAAGSSNNAPPLPQTVTLTNGTNGLSPGPSSVPGVMHAADLIGATATATVPASGLFAFDTIDDINIVAIPDLMLQGFSAQDGRNATLQAISYCENRKDCFYVADSPSGLNPQQVLAYKRGQTPYSGNAFNSEYAAIYYPWIYVADPLTGGTKLAPPSGTVVGRYSATDVARGVFKAPAGTVDGYMNSALDIERITSQGEQDTLNPEGINVIRKFADAGIVIWGARTVSSDTEWTYVPVRRLVIEIEQSILLGEQWVVFEPNDPALWQSIIRDVSAFLKLQWTSGALFGTTAAQAYFVKCDSETNPPESIALGRVVTVIGIAPVKPAEFVIFQIQLMSGGGSVSE